MGVSLSDGFWGWNIFLFWVGISGSDDGVFWGLRRVRVGGRFFAIALMARAAESAAVQALRNVMQRVQQASDRASRPASQVRIGSCLTLGLWCVRLRD